MCVYHVSFLKTLTDFEFDNVCCLNTCLKLYHNSFCVLNTIIKICHK